MDREIGHACTAAGCALLMGFFVSGVRQDLSRAARVRNLAGAALATGIAIAGIYFHRRARASSPQL